MKIRRPLNNIEKRYRIQALHDEGFTVTEIAKKVHATRKTVYLWMNRASVYNKKGSGRKKKLSNLDKKQIKSFLYQNFDASLRKAAVIINSKKRNKNINKTITHQTIENYIKTTNWGKNAYKSPKKQKLSQKNIADRLKFGKTLDKEGYLTNGWRGEQKRDHILFTDETYIEIDTYSQRKNKRYRTENIDDVPPTTVPKYNLKIMVAGGICARGKSKLIFIPQGIKVDSKYYRENILSCYIELCNQSDIFPKKYLCTIMQDSATPHTHSETLLDLKRKNINLLGGQRWPGNSPDLNPIENLWGTIKNSIYFEPLPQSIDEIKLRFQKAWDEYPIDNLKKLTESFKSRIQKMIKADGKHF